MEEPNLKLSSVEARDRRRRRRRSVRGKRERDHRNSSASMSIWKCDIPMGYSCPLRRLPSINARAFSRATFPFLLLLSKGGEKKERLGDREGGGRDVGREREEARRSFLSEIVAVPCLRASHHRYLFRPLQNNISARGWPRYLSRDTVARERETATWEKKKKKNIANTNGM